MNPLIFYHASCPDGFCAAWIARKAVGSGATFKPVRHNEGIPQGTEIKGRDIFVLDFAFPRKLTEQLAREAKSFLVLDHHKTAKEELGDLPYCHFDMDKSGARMAYEYFDTKGFMALTAWLVDYVEDRDLWRWQLPQSQEVSAAIGSYPRTFAGWDEMASCGLETLKSEGVAILRYKRQIVEHAVAGAVEHEMAGHRIRVANVTPMNLLSEVAHELAKGRPFAAVYYIFEGRKYWSLRSTKDGGVDVSQIARSFGGGGHKNAAGFTEVMAQ